MRYINIGTPETGNGNPTPHEMGCYDHTFCTCVITTKGVLPKQVAVWCLWCLCPHHGEPLPDYRTFRGHNARDPRRIDAVVAHGWCWRAEAKGVVDAGERRRTYLGTLSTQSAAEYELIWLLQQRLRAVSWPHWRLRCMQPLLSHTAWYTCQAFITLTRRPLSVSRALHVLSSRVLCLTPPAVVLLEALSRCVCTRRACCFCLRISHFCCFC